MGWAHGYDSVHNRDIGYAIAAKCDHPECDTVIDRGLSYVCGSEPYGGKHGCGLFFCEKHRSYESVYQDSESAEKEDESKLVWHGDLCQRCRDKQPEFLPKADTQ